jgi:hypothetical protein
VTHARCPLPPTAGHLSPVGGPGGQRPKFLAASLIPSQLAIDGLLDFGGHLPYPSCGECVHRRPAFPMTPQNPPRPERPCGFPTPNN